MANNEISLVVVCGLDQKQLDASRNYMTEKSNGDTLEYLRYRVIAGGEYAIVGREWSGPNSSDSDESADAPEELLATSRGCIGCTVRDDVFEILDDLVDLEYKGTLVVQLPSGSQPSCIVDPLDIGHWGTQHPASKPVTVAAVVGLVDADSLVEFADCDLDLEEAGIPFGAHGDKPVARVAIEHLMHSDVIALEPARDYETNPAVVSSFIDEFSVSASLCHPHDLDAQQMAKSHPHDPSKTRDWHESIYLPTLTGTSNNGVSSLCWREPRPLHPQRFFDALSDLAARAVYVHGHAWMINRPHEVLQVEIVGGSASVTVSDGWLASAPAQTWDQVSPQRRTYADLVWDNSFGDREQGLCAVLLAQDIVDDPLPGFTELLDKALVTEDELKHLHDAGHFDDPFEPWLGKPWQRHPLTAAETVCDGVHGPIHDPLTTATSADVLDANSVEGESQ